ncbi:hypothetical protein [Shimia sp.]|uniref:hypothetical protein n=1 Tax=Shimia sp. TaxID=1954381 RepID=UPI003B8B54A4
MRSPQEHIHNNILAGHDPLKGLEPFTAFFDMEYKRGDTIVENYKRFPIFARNHPQAKFLMNTRDKENWLRSRVRHANGLYLRREMKRRDISSSDVISSWADDFDRHLEKVQAFFEAERDRLLIYNIERDNIKSVIDFVEPEFKLDSRHWLQVRKTDAVADKLGWDAPDEMVESSLRHVA